MYVIVNLLIISSHSNLLSSLLLKFIAAHCYASAAYVVMQCLSVCLSVCHVHELCQNK